MLWLLADGQGTFSPRQVEYKASVYSSWVCLIVAVLLSFVFCSCHIILDINEEVYKAVNNCLSYISNYFANDLFHMYCVKYYNKYSYIEYQTSLLFDKNQIDKDCCKCEYN